MPLYQTDINNANDGEFFINRERRDRHLRRLPWHGIERAGQHRMESHRGDPRRRRHDEEVHRRHAGRHANGRHRFAVGHCRRPVPYSGRRRQRNLARLSQQLSLCRQRDERCGDRQSGRGPRRRCGRGRAAAQPPIPQWLRRARLPSPSWATRRTTARPTQRFSTKSRNGWSTTRRPAISSSSCRTATS